MSDVKRLKDPIYGYIDIPVGLAREVIDHPSFQRLRRITQTSYAPLYASSLHSRFVHSLGVFYLGQIAVNTILKEIEAKQYEIDQLSTARDVFLFACLLHDIGHAPFSHIGENYYLDNTTQKDQYRYKPLHDILKKYVDSDQLNKDIPNNESESAAPHEIMSVIIGIKEFGSFLQTPFERELFSRYITGYKYSEKTDQNSFLNCLISLLNSKVIDVDKLDYLIRDAFFTGFDTVAIDYQRLLSSLTIIKPKDKPEDKPEDPVPYELAYKKNAISIIENVVYAHDAARKWIQNHPVILYDIYIVRHILTEIDRIISDDKNKLFSLDTLSLEGVTFQENLKISLFCDDDIVHLTKSKLSDSLSEEYFNRKARRHPLWKSEAEYKALFLQQLGQGGILDRVESALRETEKYVEKNSDGWIINNALIKKLDEEISALEDNKLPLPPKEIEGQKLAKGAIKKVFNSLCEYSMLENQDCDFILLSASQFYSGFNRTDVGNIKIVFEISGCIRVLKFSDIVSILNGGEQWRENFFYLYHKNRSANTIQKLFSLLINNFSASS